MVFGLTDDKEYHVEAGQTLGSHHDQDGFRLSLGVDKHSPSGTCVTDLVEFFILLKLDKDRQKASMELNVEVEYKQWGWFTKKVEQR